MEKLCDMYCVKIISDLKLCNIITGLMAHGAQHPCCWCDVSKANFFEKGEERTIGNIKENFQNWKSSGLSLTRAKMFKNCVNMPLLDFDDDSKILTVLPPPELHLMLGAFNHLFKHLELQCPNITESWTTFCHVEKQSFHGGNFNGNGCKKLLRHLSFLRENIPLNLACYYKCFETLNVVVDACFGNDFNLNTKWAITKFRHSLVELSAKNAVKITPKLHVILHHVWDFCVANGCGLGAYSEQASESVHADFKKTWERFKRLKVNPKYADYLQRAANQYNSLHI